MLVKTINEQYSNADDVHIFADDTGLVSKYIAIIKYRSKDND